ncbi:MAG: Rieske (2Fe-2S) protein [Phycisphaerae bacterium]
MALIELIKLSSLKPNAGAFVERAGRELAVFRLWDPERIFVTDNACPHAGGNLSGGELDGETVACRWHQWRFCLRTGVGTESDRARVRCYPAEIRDGVVWVELPD